MPKTITHVMIKKHTLEKWRKKVGIRKATLARGLGVCPRTIARYVRRSRFPWAHFKLLQTIIKQNGGDPNSIIDRAIYVDGGQAGQEPLEVPHDKD